MHDAPGLTPKGRKFWEDATKNQKIAILFQLHFTSYAIMDQGNNQGKVIGWVQWRSDEMIASQEYLNRIKEKVPQYFFNGNRRNVIGDVGVGKENLFEMNAAAVKSRFNYAIAP